MFRRAWPLCLLLACDPAPSDVPPPPGLLEPRCTAGTQWADPQQAFAEATEAWGLSALAVEGVRLAAVDYDGDGWTDLVVRRGGSTPDGLFEPPACCADASCDEDTECPLRRTWLLRNTGASGTIGFEDVTLASGLIQNRTSSDATHGRPGEVYAFADVDNDGDLDVYTGRSASPDVSTPETSELLLGDAGAFVLGPAESEFRALVPDVPAGAAFVDYDRDGVVDLWITQNTYASAPQQDRLYRGDGSGRFSDVTAAAGLVTQPWGDVTAMNQGLAHSVAWSALACDLNGDGSAELLASSYGRAPNHLWQAQGAAFENRSIASGYAADERVDWSDNESARCHCKLHPTDEDCAGVPAPMFITCNTDADAFRWTHATDREPYRLGGNSGTTVCGDVDNDGDMDLLTTEIVHWDVGMSSDPSELLFNDGAGSFDRPGNDATGLVREHVAGWNDGDITGAIFDFDNDAWPDVYIGSTDYPGAIGLLFHQTTAQSFEPVPVALGIDHHRSHGIAVADFDRDGDLDVIVGHSLARCGGATDCYATGQVRAFENVLAPGNWLQLRLEGSGAANRAAIGARVTVTAGGVTQTQEVGGGHGHYGAQQDLTLHFGLAAGCEADVTVRWPDAALASESFHLPAGYRFRLVQGAPPVTW